MLRTITDNVKNLGGYRTNRKTVVFLVDDYGNVRLDSKKAVERMQEAGLKLQSRFDLYDTLETCEDLEMLYETLTSVKDSRQQTAVFTPFAVTRNIDFERMAEESSAKAHFERVPDTFNKLAVQQPEAYEGAWNLWQEGIANGLLSPQFHGREHLNLKVFNEKLEQKDKELLIALNNRSYSRLSYSGFPTISFTASFDFWDINETVGFPDIIAEGLKDFKEIFGCNAVHFNAPGSPGHHVINATLKQEGIRYLDTPWFHKEHQGQGKYKRMINITGKSTPEGLIKMVRNVVFEPCDGSGRDWPGFAMRQIESAFRWGKPAIISSHRVNFCGHIDPANRAAGITSLRKLLKMIVKKYPDVEFMSSADLGQIIEEDIKNKR